MNRSFRLPRLPRLVFDPCDGNALELLAGGPRFFESLRAAMESATREVLLASYLWEGDATGRAFLDAASACARRGLRVRVLTDGVGAFKLAPALLRKVDEAGGETAVHNPVRFPLFRSRLFRRNHRKVMVIDGAVGFTGGLGFADSWTAAPPKGWWDLGARVTGPVVPQFRRVFARDWERASGSPLPDLEGVETRADGDERLRFLAGRRGWSELLRQLLGALRRATDRVYVATPYFIPGFRLRQGLRSAARRGVDVRLLLPGPQTDNFVVRIAGRRHYGALLASGVRVFEYQRGFLHSKYALADRRWAALGSSNLDSWSARLSLEADLEILSPGGVERVASQFLEDLSEAREIGLASWLRRPLATRIAERVFGWFDPML